MYTIKLSYGDVDEPEMATVEILGTYESWDEAEEAAESKFDAIKERLVDLKVYFGALEAGCCDYYVTYGYYDANPDRLLAGYDHYYYISIIER